VYVVLFITLTIAIYWTAGKSNRRKGTSNSKPSNEERKEKIRQQKSKKQQQQQQIPLPILPNKKETTSDKLFRTVNDVNNNLFNSVKKTIHITTRIKRKIKSFFSSDYEVLLLQLTCPTDDKPVYYDLNRFLATTKTFVRNIDLKSESNPYRVTLRKIWSKVLEDDIRIVIKALFLLHSLLKCSDSSDALIYQSLISKMSKETVKASNCKYFDFSKINYTNDNNLLSHYKYCSFVRLYSSYIWERSKLCVRDFKEMKDIGYGIDSDDIVRKVGW